jgi:hypothetical protein
MHQIGYTSRAVATRSEKDMEALCEQSTAHNRAIGVTGLLVHDGVKYIQLIEGEFTVVRDLMARIACDSRHDNIVYIINGPIAERAFANWDLACVGFRMNATRSKLLADVKAKVANVRDVNVAAAFIGFAVLAR